MRGESIKSANGSAKQGRLQTIKLTRTLQGRSNRVRVWISSEHRDLRVVVIDSHVAETVAETGDDERRYAEHDETHQWRLAVQTLQQDVRTSAQVYVLV